MKAITTTYYGATNSHGARITARDSDGNRATIDYPQDAQGGEEAHAQAARQLCGKMGWSGTLIGGGTRDGYVFLFDLGSERYPI